MPGIKDPEYLAKRERELEESHEKVEKLKTATEDGQVAHEHHHLVHEVERRLAAVREHVHRLRDATEDTWDDVKTGVEAAWEDLMAAAYSASSKIKLP